MIIIVIKNIILVLIVFKIVLMFWLVFLDFDFIKSKLFYIGENKKLVKVKKKVLNSCFLRLIVMIMIWNNWIIMLYKSNVVLLVFVVC